MAVCHQFLVDFEITGSIVRANLPPNKFPVRRARPLALARPEFRPEVREALQKYSGPD